jgi:hypothetical protein
MAIAFDCQCGNSLRTSDVNAGKSLTCPGCRRSVTVPAAAGTLVGASTLPGAAYWNGGGGVNELAGGNKLTARALILRTAAAALLVTLACALVAAYFFWFHDRGPKEVAHFDLVPPDALVFISLRSADLDDSLQHQDVDDKRERSAVEGTIAFTVGLAMEDLERVTFVAMDEEQARPMVVATALAPVDQQHVLDALLPESEMKRHRRVPYHVASKSDLAVYFADRKTYVIATEEQVTQLIDSQRGPKEHGPRDEALRRARENRDHLVAGFDFSAEMRKRAAAEFPPLVAGMLDSVLQARGGVLTANVEKETKLQLIADYDDVDGAKSAMTTLRIAQSAGRFSPLSGGPMGGKMGSKSASDPRAALAIAALGKMETSQDDNHLRVATRLGTGELLRVLVPPPEVPIRTFVGAPRLQKRQ